MYTSNIKAELDARNERRQEEKDQKVFNFIMAVVVALPVLYLLAVYIY